MPDLLISASNFALGMMSRTSVSQSSVDQFQPTAPGTCPWPNAVVSTSTSTMRTLASLACCATQSVLTRTSEADVVPVTMGAPCGERRIRSYAAPREGRKSDEVERHREDAVDRQQLEALEPVGAPIADEQRHGPDREHDGGDFQDRELEAQGPAHQVSREHQQRRDED